jgi:hypothetical protein
VQHPLFVCIVDESIPWHFQVKEGERYQDNEMTPNPTLSLFISFRSVSQTNNIKIYQYFASPD